jgi:maltose alpha-D-glucosyltransferase/alpha-amylase
VFVQDLVAPANPAVQAKVLLIEIDYEDGGRETYFQPVAWASEQSTHGAVCQHRGSIIARIHNRANHRSLVLYDALADTSFCESLLQSISEHSTWKGTKGILRATSTGALDLKAVTDLSPGLPEVEQSNSSVQYGTQYVLKLYRRLQNGINPDLEIGLFLTDRQFRNAPSIAGWLEYLSDNDPSFTIGTLFPFIPNQGVALKQALTSLGGFYESARKTAEGGGRSPTPHIPSASEVPMGVTAQAEAVIGGYLEPARLLGQRTAELHLTLASDRDNPEFSPEPITEKDTNQLFESMVNLTKRTFALLESSSSRLAPEQKQQAEKVAGERERILSCFRGIVGRRPEAQRIRCHGDYHLEQVLVSDQDFVIIDFEGEPTRPIEERRVKRSPLFDLAGMLRSFDYASHIALHQMFDVVRKDRSARLTMWARYWSAWVSAAYLQSYLDWTRGALFLPRDPEEFSLLLDCFLLEKAVYELEYELNNRPDWVSIPIQGILGLLGR